MKRFPFGVLWALPFLIFTLLFSARATDAPQKPIIKIGVIIPLSGDNAFVGEDIRDGLLLAKERCADHERDYQFIFEDSQLKPSEAVLAAQKLISVDHVDVLLSLWGEADVVAPLAERSKTLHFSIRWDPNVAIKNHYTFTHENTYYAYIATTLKLLEKLEAKRVAVLTDKTQGWYLGVEELQRLTQTGDVKLVAIEKFIPGDRDMRTQIAKAGEAKPDLFLVLASVPEMDIVLTQLGQMYPNTPVTGYFEYIQNLKLIEGRPYIDQSMASDQFQEIFQKKYGHPSVSRAGHAFDIFNLLALAYSKYPASPKPTSDQLVAELVKVKDYPGAVGVLNVDPRHFIESPSVWKMVKEGKRVNITPDEVRPLIEK